MENHKSGTLAWYRNDLTVLAGLALFKLFIHLPVLTRYGYHHDELYFIACGRHLSVGYVDHAPLVPWIAWLSTTLFGESLFALRILATLSTAMTVFMVGLLVKRLGGGRFAQVVAGIGMIIAPVFLRTGNMLCLPAFEPLFWVLASYMVVRIIQENNPRLWLWVGIIVGAGMLNKHSMLFFGFGLVVGMLLTPMRKHFKSPWLYAGGGVVLLMTLPNLIWQIIHGWPTLNFILNLKAGVMSGISALQFLAGQLLYLHPFNAVLWISGLVYFLFSKTGKSYRILGWIWVSVFILLLVTKSKIYYMAPAYAAIIAGGGMAVEKWALKKGKKWLKPAFISFLLIGGILLGPISVPYMDIDTTENYINAITFGQFKNIYELTADLRGMFGWEKRVKTVADVFNSLSPAEQKQTVIWAFGYGNAGAIDWYGKKYGLPNAVSLSMTYWLWGVPEGKGDIVIGMGIRKENIEHIFKKVETAAEVELKNVNPWQTPFRVLICR
ncbi:MAG: glycosyltransferase family 39 protein, partial [Candidatus Aminicenantes bacterium]|nr:glycosyltransferase family 39 protein [Candidatus Aminicenantes bacterium]